MHQGKRYDGRSAGQIRDVKITTDYIKNADGSAIIECGDTRVLCTASVVPGVPPFLRGKGAGWLTAEYAMLPASTGKRKQREFTKRDGRSVEIQRLIGRSLRQAVDTSLLGERTVYIDCDVLQADGGTRAASITGAFVALVCAIDKMLSSGEIKRTPIKQAVCAISAGLLEKQAVVDLAYREDSAAHVDMNIVMTGGGEFIEIQGTGEERPFTQDEFAQMLALAKAGIDELLAAQKSALGERARHIGIKPRLIAATNNPGKLREFKQILSDKYEITALKDLELDIDIIEDGETFMENALIKARTIYKLTGEDVIADDSGICVDALDGAPGVHSARFSGEHADDEKNNELLLEKLNNVPDNKRTARYIAALALITGGKEITAEGLCEGKILRRRRGGGGFGYDPLFEHISGLTFAEMLPEEKASVSHRGIALQRLMEKYNKHEHV